MRKWGAAAAALLIGLSNPSWAQPEPSPAAASSRTEPAAGAPPTPHPRSAVQLSPQETHPEIKALAMRVALALTTYEATETLADFAARLPPELAPSAAALYRPGRWSRGRIVYPQLGGLAPDSASVMVVVEQTTGVAATVEKEVRAINVEVKRVGGRWHFERLISHGGEPVPPTAPPSPAALAVLNDPRIELPDSARWDIVAGRVSDELLQLLSRLADRASIGVVTLSAGHSWEIYGTPRQSDHSRGLAVDIYRLGERLVIEDRASGSATHGLVAWLYEQPEVARLGSPWALDGFGGRSFTDALHQDHLHVAVDRSDGAEPGRSAPETHPQ